MMLNLSTEIFFTSPKTCKLTDTLYTPTSTQTHMNTLTCIHVCTCTYTHANTNIQTDIHIQRYL